MLFGDTGVANLVRASFVALWAAMNYEQLTWVFRVEQRPVAYICASLANVALTVAGTLLLVVVLEKGAVGVIVGNFSGTLLVYLALLGYRREQLGLQFDRGLLREMNRFGLPLLPSALFLWMTNFSDRFFLVKLTDAEEVGLYSVGVRVASAMVLLLTAFRTAWPAFAYSIRDDGEARRTYAYVLTYLVLVSSWLAVALGLLSPWLVDWLAADSFAEASRVVPLLAFAAVAFAVYIVVSIGVGRIKRTQYIWVDHTCGRRRQPRTQPDADPDLRDDGRRSGDGRGLQRDGRRHLLVEPAHLPSAVPVAPGAHGRAHRRRGRRRRQAGRGWPARRDRADARLPPACCSRSASTSPPSGARSAPGCRLCPLTRGGARSYRRTKTSVRIAPGTKAIAAAAISAFAAVESMSTASAPNMQSAPIPHRTGPARSIASNETRRRSSPMSGALYATIRYTWNTSA